MRGAHTRSRSLPLEYPLAHADTTPRERGLHCEGWHEQARTRGVQVEGTRPGVAATSYLPPQRRASVHWRHQSMPVAVIPPVPLALTGQTERQLVSCGQHLQSSDAESPPVRDTIRNTSSPLEEIMEDAAALMQAPWITELPLRTGGGISPAIQFPDFGGESEDELSSRVAPRTTGGGSAARLAQRGVSGRADDLPTRPRRWPSVRAARTAEVMRLRTAAPMDFAVAPGGRPSSTDVGRQSRRIIRRRPLPSAEQENEDAMLQFLEQARVRLARQRPASGSTVLEQTPPAEGRLERFLR